jgi:hypothetical protein
MVAQDPLGGCAVLLGRDQLPDPPFSVVPERRHRVAADGNLKLDVSWQGPGGYVAVARGYGGRLARIVNPYGADVTCLDASASAGPRGAVTLLAEESTLRVGNRPPQRALGLEAYRRRWPRWAVADETQAVDRKVAYDFVLETMLIERRLEAGEARRGILAFPATPLAGRAVLRVPYRTDVGRGAVQVTWEVD